MRLWDLRTNICQGILHTPGSPVASFDQQGLVFGVGTEAGMLKLYDVRSYDKGPFDTFVVSRALGGKGGQLRKGGEAGQGNAGLRCGGARPRPH